MGSYCPLIWNSTPFTLYVSSDAMLCRFSLLCNNALQRHYMLAHVVPMAPWYRAVGACIQSVLAIPQVVDTGNICECQQLMPMQIIRAQHKIQSPVMLSTANNAEQIFKKLFKHLIMSADVGSTTVWRTRVREKMYNSFLI